MDDTLALAQTLICQPSITPDDSGCQDLITDWLQQLHFSVERLRFGAVDNLWARLGNEPPLLVFAGHTDVVPPGPLEQWTFPPFAAQCEGDFLYGRGAVDMKGGLAAMLVACRQFLATTPAFCGSIGFLITGDEEGAAVDGTRRVVELLQTRQERINWCIVGEPSSEQRLGDIVKIGRRGSLSAKLTLLGKQGHIAYPHLADNPIHRSLPLLTALCSERWDAGDAQFPATSLQISNVHAGLGVGNVIPGTLEVWFNFRYSPLVSAATLQERVVALLAAHGMPYTIDWNHSGMPFCSPHGALLAATRAAVADVTGVALELSTGGGTSDGRFIAAIADELLELGLVNATIHQPNERVAIADLTQLTAIYRQIMSRLLGQ